MISSKALEYMNKNSKSAIVEAGAVVFKSDRYYEALNSEDLKKSEMKYVFEDKTVMILSRDDLSSLPKDYKHRWYEPEELSISQEEKLLLILKDFAPYSEYCLHNDTNRIVKYSGEQGELVSIEEGTLKMELFEKYIHKYSYETRQLPEEGNVQVYIMTAFHGAEVQAKSFTEALIEAIYVSLI